MDFHLNVWDTPPSYLGHHDQRLECRSQKTLTMAPGNPVLTSLDYDRTFTLDHRFAEEIDLNPRLAVGGTVTAQ